MTREVLGMARAGSDIRTAVVASALLALATTATVVAQHQLPPKPALRASGPLAQPAADEVGVLPVQGNIYLLNLGAVNIVAQVGEDGILLVDTGPAEWSDRIVAALQTHFPGKPLRFIINTHMHPDHVGGNAQLMAFGGARSGGAGGGGGGGGGGPRLIAQENTYNRMSGVVEGDTEQPQEALPTSTFFTAKKEIYFNAESIEILYQPNAHTDGDVMVFFRGSDVIAAGDLFSTASYPRLDLARDGTIQGYLDGLNRILDITVPRFNQQGGTMVIPGHGRLCNESDVDDYRNWMTIVRDRVQTMVTEGKTLEQVKAARVTLDFDGVFEHPDWTSDQFLEAVYRTIAPAQAASH
jgi:glyoxylase-like metal-dependent hydrolase (beta-lactamase superfamily II)